MQKQFGTASELHPIVFMDREWIQTRAKSIEQTGRALAWDQAIDEFTQQKANLKLHPQTLDTLSDYFLADMAVALPIHDPAMNQWICVVFGHNPSSSAEDEARRHLYWNQFKDQAPEYHQKTIQKVLPKNEFARLTDMHETFHCLDSHYMIRARSGQYQSETLAHKAETFAEVGALLYLAQEGLKNLIETRVLFRVVGSFMVGRYQELLGPNFFSDVNFGVVYSFYPALFATQNYIDQKVEPLSLEALLKITHQIVETHSLEQNHAHAINHYQRQPEKLQKLIDDFRDDKNEKLRAKFNEVEKYRDEYASVVDWAFSELLADSPEN